MNPNKSVTALDSVFDHYQEIAGPGSFQKAVQISPFFLLPFRPILSELIRELATQKSLYYPKHQNRAGLHHKLREKILHLRRPWQGPWRAGRPCCHGCHWLGSEQRRAPTQTREEGESFAAVPWHMPVDARSCRDHVEIVDGRPFKV